MTLCTGDHIVKLDSKGEPLMDPQRESYVEFEIVDLSPTYLERAGSGLTAKDPEHYETVQFAKLRKVR